MDPKSHAIRSYYPDLLVQGADETRVIVEVKRDDQIDAPVDRAKHTFAEQSTAASNMTYYLLRASGARAGRHEVIWRPEQRDVYLDAIVMSQLLGPHD